MELISPGVQYSVIGLCVLLIIYSFAIVKLFTTTIKEIATAVSSLVAAIEKLAIIVQQQQRRK